MIKTFFGTGTLDTPWAFLAALVIGLLFGLILERAGFGSSRRLTGVFYFTDMAVLKVMFSAMLTAMLGLAFAQVFGLIAPAELYVLPTVYGAQIVGGLIFGVGFVMGGWCPGTAAVGAASGYVFEGQSCLVDPLGRLLCDAGRGETVVWGDVDLALCADARAVGDYLNERRPDLYD